MIFDSNVLFGFDLQSSKDLSIEKTLSLMKEKKIDKALITNIKCKYYNFMEGNEETAVVIKRYPGEFLGMLSFNMSQFLDIEKEICKGLNELNLSGIRIFNTSSGFISEWGGGIDSYSMRKVLKQVTGLKIPVFIEGGFPFITVGTLAREFPEVPIIASGTGYGNMGEAILAVQENKNLFLEISTLDTMDGIDVLVEYLTADKIIFGTGMPYNSPSCEILMVKSSNISDQDKDKIFSGNLLKILGERSVNKC